MQTPWLLRPGQKQPGHNHGQMIPIMCESLNTKMYYDKQETTDYGRPIVVVLETGLQNPDEGPVLDPDWQSTQRTEVRASNTGLNCLISFRAEKFFLHRTLFIK